jgi:hypothetical protein
MNRAPTSVAIRFCDRLLARRLEPIRHVGVPVTTTVGSVRGRRGGVSSVGPVGAQYGVDERIDGDGSIAGGHVEDEAVDRGVFLRGRAPIFDRGVPVC